MAEPHENPPPYAEAMPPHNEPKSTDVLIAVMGLTGSGKSTFINLATQSEKKLAVGHDYTSCTDTVDVAEPFQLDGRRVFLYDTPGFDDTNKSGLEILRIITIALEEQYRTGIKLHGVIYAHKMSENRVGGMAKQNFHIFRKLCGDKNLQNVVIMTTMWSRITEEEGRRRVANMESMDDFFKPAFNLGARMMKHTDSVECARDIIRSILKNHPVPLDIQDEIVNQNKSIDETAASKEVDKKYEALKAEFAKNMKEQLEAAEAARKEQDEITRQEQLEAARKWQKKLDDAVAEMARHVQEYEKLQEANRVAEEARRKAQAEADEADRKARVAEEERRKARIEADEAARKARIAAEDAERRARIAAEDERRRADARIEEEQRRARAAVEEERRRAQEEQQRQSVPQPPPGQVEPGKSHVMFAEGYSGTFATINGDSIYGTEKSLPGRYWIISRSRQYWTIKSRNTGKYIGINSSGEVRAQSEECEWTLKSVANPRWPNVTSNLRIYATGRWTGYTLVLENAQVRISSSDAGWRGVVWDVFPSS